LSLGEWKAWNWKDGDEWEGIENRRGWFVNGLFHGRFARMKTDCGHASRKSASPLCEAPFRVSELRRCRPDVCVGAGDGE
jgi:hypothetical protein